MNYNSIIWKNSTTFCLLTEIIGFRFLAPPLNKIRESKISKVAKITRVEYPSNYNERCVSLQRGFDAKVTFFRTSTVEENFNWGVRRKLNVILAFVNVCCFLIFPLLTVFLTQRWALGWLIGAVHYKLINIVWSVTIYQMITPALGKKNKLANNVTVLSWPATGSQRRSSQRADAVKRVLADRSLNTRRCKRVFVFLAFRFTDFCQVYLGQFCLNLKEVVYVVRSWTYVAGEPRAVFKMPKSFLVKNKKARRIEDEIQDGTKVTQCEDQSPGKHSFRTSLQGKIFLVPLSTWPFDKRFCS